MLPWSKTLIHRQSKLYRSSALENHTQNLTYNTISRDNNREEWTENGLTILNGVDLAQ